MQGITNSSTSEDLSGEITALDNRVTALEQDANGDVKAFLHDFNFICNDVNLDADTNVEYPYCDTITFAGIDPDENHIIVANVFFNGADAVSGNFAPFVSVLATGGVRTFTVYSKTEMQTTHSAKVLLSKIRLGS